MKPQGLLHLLFFLSTFIGFSQIPQIDVAHYKIEIDLSDESDQIKVDEEIKFVHLDSNQPIVFNLASRDESKKGMHIDALKKGERVILIDDLIDTGSTALAAIELINKMEAEIIENLFLIDLTFLGGSKSIKKLGHKVFSICNYEGE